MYFHFDLKLAKHHFNIWEIHATKILHSKELGSHTNKATTTDHRIRSNYLGYSHLYNVKLQLSEHSIYNLHSIWQASQQRSGDQTSDWSQTESSLKGWAARRNQVLNAVTKWGQSSTFRVEKLRHFCSNSWASDMGRVEIIRRNVSSSSRYNDLLLTGEKSLQTTKTGSQSSTSFLLTWIE